MDPTKTFFDPFSDELVRRRALDVGLAPLPLTHPFRASGPLVYIVGETARGRILEIQADETLAGIATRDEEGWFYIVRDPFEAIVHDLETGGAQRGSSNGTHVALYADRLYHSSPNALIEAYARLRR